MAVSHRRLRARRAVLARLRLGAAPGRLRRRRLDRARGRSDRPRRGARARRRRCSARRSCGGPSAATGGRRWGRRTRRSSSETRPAPRRSRTCSRRCGSARCRSRTGSSWRRWSATTRTPTGPPPSARSPTTPNARAAAPAGSASSRRSSSPAAAAARTSSACTATSPSTASARSPAPPTTPARRIGVELHHAGRNTNSGLTGEQPVAPSPVACAEAGGELPRELTAAEIDAILDAYGAAAARAAAAGLDALELHSAHGYLPYAFLSPLTNHRRDEYGGSLENRSRFALRAIAAIRAAVGPDVAVGCRFSAAEHLDGGLTLEDTRRYAQALAGAGVDYLSVSTGVYASFVRIIPPMDFAAGLAARHRGRDPRGGRACP